MNNPNAIKTRFAIRFVRAMKRLNKSRGMSMSMRMSMREQHKRYRAVKAAAYASMASAVGPERAWSRAVLRKIRLRHLQIKRRRFARRNPRVSLGFGLGREEDLRGLVPGGRGMGECSLLSETAHYINCLQAQVQVMTDILHHYSN